MFKKIFLLFFIALFLSTFLQGRERGFAVVADSATFKACQNELKDYEILLQREGFSLYFAVDNWNSPEPIKELLYNLYLNNSLEGALFVGEIPIAMVRDAQHLTSAFKMDQRNPLRSSSVPSDRFYDDFDLKFDPIAKEEGEALFYYTLRWDSPQYIQSDIYTSRVKATLEGEEGYRQIREYFKKVVAERSRENPLDVIVSYTGEGSFSNSLTAWRGEALTIGEQFPGIYRNRNSLKFLFFDMYPSMKEIVINELKRPDVDLMLFHEHGLTKRQYLTGIPLSKEVPDYYKAAQRTFMSFLMRRDSSERKKAIEEWSEKYHLDSSWFAIEPKEFLAPIDSLERALSGIDANEVEAIAPNPRVVIFDACYNGDFRERSFIAGEYIMAPGKTLVTLGNSVNVLQDKSSSDLMGLLSLGFSVGEWAKETNILESHLFGDPTFRFTPAKEPQIDLNSTSQEYWLSLFESAQHPDIKGLALRRLHTLEYGALASLLTDTYFNSPFSTLRYQAFYLLTFQKGHYLADILEYSCYDPNEFIRRKSIYLMGRVGLDRFIPHLASVYINDYLDERVHFNTTFSFDLVDSTLFRKSVEEGIAKSFSIVDKEGSLKEFKRVFGSRQRVAESADAISDSQNSFERRLRGVTMLRNYPYHYRLDNFFNFLLDSNQPQELRVAMAEALGWFTLSHRRNEIISHLKEVAAQNDTPLELKNEALKSVRRIEHYMR
ncbi:MAG: hypothetical protein WC960_00910 [Bacteroidales bacterium]